MQDLTDREGYPERYNEDQRRLRAEQLRQVLDEVQGFVNLTRSTRLGVSSEYSSLIGILASLKNDKGEVDLERALADARGIFYNLDLDQEEPE